MENLVLMAYLVSMVTLAVMEIPGHLVHQVLLVHWVHGANLAIPVPLVNEVHQETLVQMLLESKENLAIEDTLDLLVLLALVAESDEKVIKDHLL